MFFSETTWPVGTKLNYEKSLDGPHSKSLPIGLESIQNIHRN